MGSISQAPQAQREVWCLMLNARKKEKEGGGLYTARGKVLPMNSKMEAMCLEIHFAF